MQCSDCSGEWQGLQGVAGLQGIAAELQVDWGAGGSVDRNFSRTEAQHKKSCGRARQCKPGGPPKKTTEFDRHRSPDKDT